MIDVGRNIDARAGADFHGRLVVNHLFSFPRHDINNFLRARMVVSGVAFSGSEFNNPETEANRSGHCGFAQEVDFSPIEFETINVLNGSNEASSKFMHSSGGYFLMIS